MLYKLHCEKEGGPLSQEKISLYRVGGGPRSFLCEVKNQNFKIILENLQKRTAANKAKRLNFIERILTFTLKETLYLGSLIDKNHESCVHFFLAGPSKNKEYIIVKARRSNSQCYQLCRVNIKSVVSVLKNLTDEA